MHFLPWISSFERCVEIQDNENFKQIPENKLVEGFIFIFNLVNAILHHHLSVMELFDIDDKFVEYLSNLVAFSLKYNLKENYV